MHVTYLAYRPEDDGVGVLASVVPIPKVRDNSTTSTTYT